MVGQVSVENAGREPMNDIRGRWAALLIVLLLAFLILIQWGVASLQRALDWSPEELPFIAYLAYGLAMIGVVLLLVSLLALALTLGMRQIFEELGESRDRRRFEKRRKRVDR